MRLARVAIADIVPAEENPRQDLQPSDPEYQAIKRSIERWDMVEPLVWNEQTNHLVSGHQRLKVLAERGDTEVDVSVVDLDVFEERALGVALNKVAGRWDDLKLADLMVGLDGALDDLTVTGFSAAELETLLKAVAPPAFETSDAVAVTAHDLREAAVTTEQFTSAQLAAETKFKGGSPRVIRDVTCPSCGHSFGVVVS